MSLKQIKKLIQQNKNELALQKIRNPASAQMSAAARKLGETKYNWSMAKNSLLGEYEAIAVQNSGNLQGRC